MLEDGHLDRDEAAELCATLKQFSGKDSAAGELLRTTDLPLNQPAPSFRFRGRHFVCTGTFAYGKRERCHEAIEYRGGVVKSGISKKVDYLILGYYVTPSWKHEQFGRKIEKAMLYRDQGVPISIISEEHWRKHGGI